MRSKFILGLYMADKEILANFIAIWEQATIVTLIKSKTLIGMKRILTMKITTMSFLKF